MGREYQADLKPIRDELLSELNKLRNELHQSNATTQQKKGHQKAEHRPECFVSNLQPLRDELIFELNKLRNELLSDGEQNNSENQCPLFETTDSEDE